MAATPPTELVKQIRRARTRLFWQAWLDAVPLSAAALLALAACWLVLEPFLVGHGDLWWRWAVVGGSLALGAVVALVLTWRRRPSPLDAALALDRRFGLKERTTTALTLTEDQAQTPAGQALLADAHAQLARQDVRGRFPLRLSWRRALVPVGAAVLAILAVFVEPSLRPVDAQAKNAKELAAEKAKAIEKALD